MMPQSAVRPTVLVLVQQPVENTEVQRLLRLQGAIPVSVRPGGAVAAIAHYKPSAVVIDLAHLATAPDDFLAAAEASRVDVVCISDAANSRHPGSGKQTVTVVPRPGALVACTLPP